VHYDSLIVDYRKVRDWVVESLQRIQANPVRNQRQIDIPTIYGGEFGIDLDFVADYHKMSVNEIVYLHSEAIYTVYMMGFTPGFAYLGGLPEDLATPRLENPRTLVKAGSIGIAGNQTGIYPIDSPGGWRIIGYTSIRLFNPFLDSPTLLTPGDQVRFVPVSSPG
jgi:inhibitor of KinA